MLPLVHASPQQHFQAPDVFQQPPVTMVAMCLRVMPHPTVQQHNITAQLIKAPGHVTAMQARNLEISY